MDRPNNLDADITEPILNGFFHVYKTLGYGFLEKIYENALFFTLKHRGIIVEQQYPIKVFFENLLVGEYFADLLVGQRVMVELKAAEARCCKGSSFLTT